MSTSITCSGLTGQVTGLRARLIIGDDIENPKDDSPEAVDRLEDAIAEFVHIAVPGALTKLLGTPQTEFSLYGRLARSEAWTVFRACLFDTDQLEGDKEVFHSRWPSRFPEKEILQKKRAVTKRAFDLHYRLDLSATADQERPLKLSDLPVLDWDPMSHKVPIVIRGQGLVLSGLPRGAAEGTDEWHGVSEVSTNVGGYTTIIGAVDPASGLRGGAHDAIGLAVVGFTQGGRAIIRAARGVRGDTTREAMQETARLLSAHRVNKLLVEENKASTFGNTLSAMMAAIGHPMIPEAVQTGGVKKARRIIETLSPALATGKVFVCRDVLTDEDGSEFINQWTDFTYDGRSNRGHDDIVDALSYAIGALGEAITADEASFVAAQQFDFDALSQMPLRRRILNDEELEAYCTASEDEIETQLKLDRALALQQQDLAAGRSDPWLEKHIATLSADLVRIQGGRLRISLPAHTRRQT